MTILFFSIFINVTETKFIYGKGDKFHSNVKKYGRKQDRSRNWTLTAMTCINFWNKNECEYLSLESLKHISEPLKSMNKF